MTLLGRISTGGPADRNEPVRKGFPRTEPGGSGFDGSERDASGFDRSGSDGSEPDGSGVDRAGFDGTGFDGSEPDLTGVSGARSDASERDGSERHGSGADRTGLDRAGFDGTGFDGSGPGRTGFDGTEVDRTGSDGTELGDSGADHTGGDGSEPCRTGLTSTGLTSTGFAPAGFIGRMAARAVSGLTRSRHATPAAGRSPGDGGLHGTAAADPGGTRGRLLDRVTGADGPSQAHARARRAAPRGRIGLPGLVTRLGVVTHLGRTISGGPGHGGGGPLPGRGAGADVPGVRSARPRDTDRGTSGRDTLRAWSELLRVSALFTVPGDALAGAAAVGLRPNRGTALALGASLCLYEAGMALNDWADRDEDAIDRPHRPIPSGRITPPAALAAAAVLTATGLTLASRAGRPALTAATALAATVWAYDLRLKHTKAGPAAMAAARSLDLLLGAVATATASTAHRTSNPPSPAPRGAVTDEWTSDGWASGGGPAGRGTTTLASGRRNPPHLDGCSPASPSLMAAALAEPAPTGPAQEAGAAVTGPPPAETASTTTGPPASTSASTTAPTGTLTSALPAALVLGAHTYAVTSVSRHEVHGGSTLVPLAALATALGLGLNAVREGRPLNTALAGTYIRAAGVPFLHAALNPSPQLTQGAVGGGIRAMIPLQAVIAARAGGGAGNATALALTALVPLARKLARKVSPT